MISHRHSDMQAMIGALRAWCCHEKQFKGQSKAI